ncbi:MAG: response regulator [Polyangiaceae bacterium]|nr:response regulator [Polyangiaceae bacterium]
MSRILVIDDDEAFGLRTVKTLKRAGFDARFHRGPFGTLGAVRESRCDVVLLDVSMPKLDGAALVRMIRETFSSNRIRVVLFSNMEVGALQRLAGWVGAHDAISKSAGDADLVAQVSGVIAARSAESWSSAPRKPTP